MVSENAGIAQMPFAAALGVVLDAAAADEVRGRLAWAPERCTTSGIMHGGALMGLADTLGGLCAFLNLPPAARRPDHDRGADRPGRRGRAAGGAGHPGAGGARR